MWIEKFVLAWACAATCGCTQAISETRSLPPAEEEVLLPPAAGEGDVLRASFTRDGDFVAGHVEWAATCRRALLVYPRSETVTRSVPRAPAAVAAGMGAVGAGTAGTLLFTHRTEFSNVQTCELDAEGDETCSSPREKATVGGLVLVGTGIALATASIVTLASKPQATAVDVTRGPALPPRIVERDVPCGEGAVDGLGLALYRGGERIAVATTDADGDVSFAVPARSEEPLTLKAEQVPLGFRTIVRGQALATLRPERAPKGSAW